MPTINSEPFLKLPRMLRLELRLLFEYATAMLKNKMSDMLPKYNRRKQSSMKLNNAMGFKGAKMEFEYYDIVLTRNCILPGHIDEKNDHCAGYNFVMVYSFFRIIDSLEYKVSVIMTTRSTVGAALDKIKKSAIDKNKNAYFDIIKKDVFDKIKNATFDQIQKNGVNKIIK